jgi:hypothetical protein
MMDAKQYMNNINKKLSDTKKLKDVPSKNTPSFELNEKIRKLEDDLRRAKEVYRNKKREYEEDLQTNHPEEYAEYNLNRLKKIMEKTHEENKESELAVRKLPKSKGKEDRDKAALQAERTGQKYRVAKAAYDAAVAAAAAAAARPAGSPAGSPEDLFFTPAGSPETSGGSSEKEIDYESIIHRLLSKKSLENFKNLSTAEIEEIRKKNPFPFEIALALGFIKKTDDGYELVERRIQKLKGPIIESMSFLNHRTNKKGVKKGVKKGGENMDAPLENHELDSLREALTGIKMLHTASIYAVTREAVEIEDKQKMTGGASVSDSNGKSDPEPFLNISQTLNQLKPTDMKWLQERFPNDFKIAEKLGIVDKGGLSHSAKDILNDTAEMSKSIIKKRIPKASQKVLYPKE